VNMVGEKMPFLNPALFLLGQFAEHLAQMLAQVPYSTFLRHFGMKTMWYLHSHFEWLKLSYSSIRDSP
jgi:hypothetical protein